MKDPLTKSLAASRETDNGIAQSQTIEELKSFTKEEADGNNAPFKDLTLKTPQSPAAVSTRFGSGATGQCFPRDCLPDGDVPARIQPGLAVLFEAWQYAEQTSGEYWEFAVELTQLSTLGLTRNDFRWLVRKGLVDHQRDVTLDGDRGRVFRPTGDLSFPDGTCFILTAAGAAVATRILGAPTTVSPVAGCETIPAMISIPQWDGESRELRLDGKTVKRFKWHAVNQEIILCAFQEENWPVRIDDPLPPHPDQDPKRRLSDTIKCLNRKQTNRLIHFRGDGTGEGITWERVNLGAAR